MAWTNLLGQVRVGIRGSVSQSQTQSLLLDTYSGAAAAYSLRKLNTSYTGSAIRVRRSSDNTEQNIGFNADGTLNTLALLAFVGSGTGFVTTWYDQSGNNRNATQVSASNQPLIVNGGVLYTLNGKAIIRNPNTNVIRCLITPISSSQTRPISIIASGKIYSLPSNGFGNVAFYLGGTVNAGGGSRYEFYVYNNSFGTQIRYQSTAVSNINTYNIYSSFIHQGHFASSVLTSRLNGIDSTITITDSTPFATNSNFALIGANAITTDFMANIGMYEYIFYFSDRTSDRVGIESNINTHYSIYATDTDAQAFINAAAITDGTQIRAIDTLVTSLKSAGIWTKMKAIYPFVGGNAASHKFNLKDPRDLDAAFRLAFNGGWTHNSNGALSNGSNSYADTKLVPSSILSLNNTHISSYIRDFSPSYAGVLLGTNKTSRLWIAPSFSSLYGIFQINNVNVTFNSRSSNGGLWLGSRRTSTNEMVFNNGSLHLNITANSTTLDDGKIYIAARNDGAIAANYFIGTTAFASIGDGLTDTEATSFYAAVQEFQTSLGRQV